MENVAALNAEKINYIVGARLGNITTDLLTKIVTKLPRTEGSIIRLSAVAGVLACNIFLIF
jgi:hypothetical protein